MEMTNPTTPVPVPIAEEPIRLGQFLKLANLAQDGLEAKTLILQGDVRVNQVVESRRGRKLIHGDRVTIHGVQYVVQCGPV